MLPVEQDAMAATTETTMTSNLTTTATIEELASNYTLYAVAEGLNKYWLPFIVVVGFCGNTLSLMVMLLSHNRTFTTCLYLAALAVSDNVILVLGGHFWIATVIHGKYMSVTPFLNLELF